MSKQDAYNDGWNAAITKAAKVAAAEINKEWPGDELSCQARGIEQSTLELKQ